MKAIRTRLSFILLASIAISVSARDVGSEFQPDPTAAKLDSKALGKLDAAMEKQVADKKVSGVIGLIARNGQVGYYETHGQRFIEQDKPMAKDTLFRIYSMTKPIVAVTAMAIWEEGKFKLDDPIATYCPEWKEPVVRNGEGTEKAKSPVTARQLFTHSSGLTYDRKDLNLSPTATLEEFSASAAKKPLKFHPGTQYAYGYSTDILGRYIEAVEGKPLDVVMRERVFDKLGMDDTDFWVRNPEDRGRVAMVYTKGKGGSLRPAMKISDVMKKPARMMGGQGLMSTTEDYARFCAMMANKGEYGGARVLKAETIDLMLQNHLKDIEKVYGLGGMVNGEGGYHWGGAAGTRFWIDTKENGFGVFMIQTWGYKAPTFGVFERHAREVLGEPAK